MRRSWWMVALATVLAPTQAEAEVEAPDERAASEAAARADDARRAPLFGPAPYPRHPWPAPPYPAYGLQPPAFAVPTPGWGSAPRPAEPAPDLVATLEASEEFGTLIRALELAELTSVLRDGEPYTLFAPTNAAFDALPDGVLEELLADTARLRSVLDYHIVRGRHTAADLLIAGEIETLSGHEIEIDDPSVRRADMKARNGVIHVVDEVMAPPIF